MSYEVKQGNIFGRVGESLGKALSEQVPKEVERVRLAKGLQQFEQESGNLTPMQQLSRLAAIPGALDRPELVRQFGELARQQARGNVLKDIEAQKNIPQPSPFPKTEPKTKLPGSQIPSLTQEEPFAKAQEGYIPRTQDEILAEAGQRYNENPALFGNDPQKAIEFAENSEQKRKDIAEAYQKKHENLTAIQDNVVTRLKDYSNRLGVQIPANVYSKIEDKAIQATKPKDQGGSGLTEQQAMKLYGEELDNISRDYKAIDTLGNWGITGRPAGNTLANIKSLQKKFEERNDSENMADTMVAQNGLSNLMAYSLAEPVSNTPELRKELSKIPTLQKKVNFKKGYQELAVPKEYLRDETLKISKKLAPLLADKGSPLAVAYELEKKNYDPAIWMDYLDKNRKELGLKESQGRQIDKPRNFLPSFNDWWLSSWSGIGE